MSGSRGTRSDDIDFASTPPTRAGKDAPTSFERGAPRVGSIDASAAIDAQPEDANLGAIVGGKFRIDAVLGKGGMGQVYRATHLAFGEPVAVKFLKRMFAGDPELRARFRREALALARLRHPHVVSVHDFGEHEGGLFLVMELVDGEPLHERLIVDGRTMPLARVAAILDQILQVLEVAHAMGIVHRDLKADNVMLLRGQPGADHVKVLDFGLAYLDEGEDVQRLTATDAVFGTAAYMSPEQCRGERVGPETDVYAAGVLLFELLTGVLPFRAANRALLMTQQMFVDPPALAESGVRPDVPAGVEAVVRRAMEKIPGARPSPAEMRAELAEAVAGRDVASRAAASSRERRVVALADRDERALPAPTAHRAPSLAPAPPAAGAPPPRVALWGFDAARVEALRTALAVHGLAVAPWPHGEPPPLMIDGEPVRAVVLAGDAHAPARTATLRADPLVGRALLVVADVPSAAAMTDLIRAGASDALLAAAGDEGLAPKLQRLMRRGR